MVAIVFRGGNGHFYRLLLILSVLISICHGHGHRHTHANLNKHAVTESPEAAAPPSLHGRNAETSMSPEEDWADMSVKRQHSALQDLESVITKREDYSCDEHNPCSNNACCAKRLIIHLRSH